jgi:hypothetical protein
MSQTDNYNEPKNFSQSSFDNDYSAELFKTVECVSMDYSDCISSFNASDKLVLPALAITDAAGSSKGQGSNPSDQSNPPQDRPSREQQEIARIQREIARAEQAVVTIGLTRLGLLMDLGNFAHSNNPIKIMVTYQTGTKPGREWDEDISVQINAIKDKLTDSQIQPIVDYFRRHGRMIPGTRQLTGVISPNSPDLNLQRAIDLENYMRSRRQQSD